MLLCSQTPACEWSSYNDGILMCSIFQDCPTLDETCTNCVTSSSYCQTRKRYSKIMVGLGYTADGYTSNVEVIDLSSSSTACPPFPAYPLGTNAIKHLALTGCSTYNNPQLHSVTRWLDYCYNILAIYNNELLHNSIKSGKVGTQFCQILNKLSKNLPKTYKILPNWWNFAKSSHTAMSMHKI